MPFQFTPLREGRLGAMLKSMGIADISIHAPPRGATMLCSKPKRLALFQFTPLREGRPGATIVGSFIRLISIHAPPRGATSILSRFRVALANFNSRPSARGDSRLCEIDSRGAISIHAPPRGATPPRNSTSFPQKISIHAPPRGATFHAAYSLL